MRLKIARIILPALTATLLLSCHYIDGSSKYYPIHKAADKGDIAKIQELIDNGEDINRKSHPAKNTPLIVAVANGRVECCKYLLDHGANPSQAGLFGAESRTPLQLAAINGNLDIIKLLLSYGIGPDEDAGSYTAFHYACKNGHLEAAEALLAAGADINTMDSRGATPLRSAINLHQDDIFYWLLDEGVDVDAKKPWYAYSTDTALYRAIDKSDLKKVQALVERGADVNVDCLYGTPLMNAVKHGHVEIAQYLLKNGAQTVYSHGDETVSIIEEANRLGNPKIIELFKQHP
jgi:ankyrin repeat protein